MIEEILDNLFVIYSPNEGSNCYLLVGKKNILIDSSTTQNASYLKNSLKDIGLDAGDINIVLHTHGHADHIGGGYLFPKAEKLMHGFDAGKINLKDNLFSCASFFPGTKFPKITKKLKEGDVIKNEPFSLKVICTPGHTKGSISFYEENNKILFSGDCLFKGSIGRYDLPSSSKQDVLESLKKLLKIDYRILLPGHGLVLKENQDENIERALYFLEKSVELEQI